jgi:DNA-binding SARP family transcriptional activator
MPSLNLNLLGPPSVLSNGEPVPLSPGATMLCAYLALAPREGRPRSVAATQLFGDCSERLARRRLNTALWRLKVEIRSSTGLDIVASTGRWTVALSPEVDVTTDAARFQALIELVLRVPPTKLDDTDVVRLNSAVSLRRGQLIETCQDDWVLAARYRIDNLYLAALDYLVQHHGARGDIPAITEYGERALELEPLREDLHRHLICAYAAAGRMDLAERQFERCRAVLLEELGTDPMPETVATYARLRGGRGGRSTTVAALVAELERARRDVGRLAAAVDRALDQLRGMS